MSLLAFAFSDFFEMQIKR